MRRGDIRLIWMVFGAAAALAFARPLPAMADPPDAPFLGISEFKLGALYHDPPGLWSNFSVEKPTADEQARLLRYLEEQRQTDEAQAWTLVARVLLNLDEFITRE